MDHAFLEVLFMYDVNVLYDVNFLYDVNILDDVNFLYDVISHFAHKYPGNIRIVARLSLCKWSSVYPSAIQCISEK